MSKDNWEHILDYLGVGVGGLQSVIYLVFWTLNRGLQVCINSPDLLFELKNNNSKPKANLLFLRQTRMCGIFFWFKIGSLIFLLLSLSALRDFSWLEEILHFTTWLNNEYISVWFAVAYLIKFLFSAPIFIIISILHLITVLFFPATFPNRGLFSCQNARRTQMGITCTVSRAAKKNLRLVQLFVKLMRKGRT